MTLVDVRQLVVSVTNISPDRVSTLQKKIVVVKTMFMNYLSRLRKWYSICSEADAKPPAKTYVAQFSALYQIFLVLEYQVALSFSVFVLSSTSVLLPPSVSTLKLGVLIT